MTNQNLASECGARKAIAQQNLSNPAKLLAGYMAATGISEAKVIAESLGIPLRTVQRLKLEVATASANSATDGVSQSAKDAMGGVSDAPNAPDMAFSPSRVEDNNYISPLEDISQHHKPSSRAAKPASRCKRGARLPDDWALPKSWGDWTLTNCPTSNPSTVREQADIFADYWHAQPGQKAVKTDWQATWRNWCRKAFATAPTRGGYAAAKPANVIRLHDASVVRNAKPAPGSVMMEVAGA